MQIRPKPTAALTKPLDFTQSASTEMTAIKKHKNRIYRICGWVIVFGILIAGVYLIQNAGRCSTTLLILWLEWIMIWSFGFAWLVKSGIILRDKSTQN